MANTAHQSKRKYHTVYQTTNLLNNKIYIGSHSTDDLEDDYLGSGTNISRAIEKYGKESFKKDILYIFETPKEMLLKEKEIVTSDFLKRDDVYNIVEGGYGGYNKGSTGLKHMHHTLTKERCAVHPSAVDKMLLDGWVVGRNTSSTTNTIWVYKGQRKKMILSSKLNEYIETGWIKGLPESPTRDMVWIYNPTSKEYSLCKKKDLEEKISNGWIKKKWSPIKKGTMWVNNGISNLRIDSDNLDSYLLTGWKKGMLTSRWS